MLIDQIKKDFDRVIQYSQKINEPKTKELFDNWYKAKKSFIDAFGGKLIYEYPETVSFELNQEEKEKHMLHRIPFHIFHGYLRAVGH